MLEPDVYMTLYIFFTFRFFTDIVTFGGEDFTHVYDLLILFSVGADVHLVNHDD